MKKVNKKFRKIFIRWVFLSAFLLSSLLVILKLYIPDHYQFIEPISIYWSILSSVIFIYWFILAPLISEYKESERILTDIKNSINNIKDDIKYFKILKNDFDEKWLWEDFSKILMNFYNFIADDIQYNNDELFHNMMIIISNWEKLWITANHIIRLKQEISIVKKWFLRISDIKDKSALPSIVYSLKNFITFIVIAILLFLDIWTWSTDVFVILEESVMLFLISFLYIYLSFIINGFDNPFDKRRFTWFLDIWFLKEVALDLKK